MRRGLPALLVTVVLLLGACGGGSGGSGGSDGGGDLDAAGVADATSARLAKVDAATVDLSFSGSTEGSGAGGGRPALGFRLQGPYALDGDDPLPVAELTYTRLVGTKEETATFLSTGTKAYVRTGDDTYVLPPDRVAGLSKGTTPDSGFEDLRLGSWFVAPKLTRDGDDDVVRGKVRADVAFADLAALAGRLGVPDHAELDALAKEDRAALERVIESSSLKLVATHDDHLLRTLDLRVDLAGAASPGSPLASLGKARIDLHLGLSKVGDEVHVEAPAGAKPLP